MKNRLPFAALTFAFTIAGACLGYLVNQNGPGMLFVVLMVAVIGAVASGLCGDQL